MSVTEPGLNVTAREWRWYLYRVCAWCQCELGTTPCRPSQDRTVTHGICAKCQREQLELLNEVGGSSLGSGGGK